MIHGLKPRLAESGKIKIGRKGDSRPTRDGRGTWAPPVKEDHFTITTTQREGGDSNANLIVHDEIMTALVRSGYADADGMIRTLPIVVYSDVIDEVFPTALVAYQGKLCACRGDGQTATRYEIAKDPSGRAYRTGKTKPVDCPCELIDPDSNGARRCKYSGILHCSLRLPGFARLGSIYTWRTTSQISCSRMIAALQTILTVAGSMRGLPLTLRVQPVQVSPVGGRSSTVYCCHVDLDEEVEVAQRQALAAAEMRRQLAGGMVAELDAGYRDVLQLPGGDTEDQADVADEYYPDAVIDSPIAGAISDITDEQRAALQAPVPQEAPFVTDADLAPQAIDPDGAMGIGKKPSHYLDNATRIANPGPSPAEVAEQQAAEQRRTRRTKCQRCGELWGPGIVVKGLCARCRAEPPPASAPEQPEQQEQPDPDIAPEIVSAPPARPSTATTGPRGGREAINAMIREAVTSAPTKATAILGAIRGRWADADDRDWSETELDEARGIVAKVLA